MLAIFLYILLIIAQGLIFGYLTQSLFKYKNKEGGFLLGFFLSIIALIYAAGLPVLDNSSTKTTNKQDDNNKVNEKDNEEKYIWE